ncbi:MAG: UDP-N-acetylglucosamine 1-carboxyvinyltransferase [Candidatus Spechtbacteria bacterium RIFCSPLOWO2_12_FULL_38_22]|uniref:UDP-N-acetylglucosamine 1-carboxyvinyltransferase n=1 Tax=Candidatus Spechtbacteria bacterium RIFCSPLOWO2_12_FULL_38_22 TaxID=1802165 RepID=A0A1G2HJ99_9BACT|nr:MAG: UDP-N-acetylglucosamine 1-carboxyvinyltransferase [Candidatus Spechtbacteria bacterium RIFCSPHIGHO2_12_FULL_38_30]OGZ61064.1 MAG: UDP-N-acetylglucosamine 1-carboxyvinyltransferase [Candidatus Spechtbacteria bacterium RIFCSPLOWO2_01_FULL_38_20]OGZ62350.1 MAG: UDP-N-acetylglucosamine 1-carboxyvinyltransferase [Candidatus Spechtbacteria bacterium RIFCSPLOWO2_12_FULL_38_22]
MSDSFLIKGGNLLRGDVHVSGSKNAALKLIAATLLTDRPCKLTNVPILKDVEVMFDILRSIGSDINQRGRTVYISNKNIKPSTLDYKLVGKVRGSVVIMGPLLSRFGSVVMPYPGGDKIGRRPLSFHFNLFRDLGFSVKESEKNFTISKSKKMPQVSKVILDGFSVTATETALMWAAGQEREIEFSTVAEEPHIQNLVEMLRRMGANIQVKPQNQIVIRGKKSLRGVDQRVIYDYIEAGTWVVAGLVVGGDIRICNFPTQDLKLFLHRLKRIGANIEIINPTTVRVKTSPNLKAFRMDVRIHPGIAADLQSPLGVLGTQCNGTSEIFDTLYEGRLSYLKELKKMGANVKILDVHRAYITGPTKLKGIKFVKKEDIRGGMSLIIAGLVASGQTFIKDAYQVDRGYEKIDQKLFKLGANIQRI